MGILSWVDGETVGDLIYELKVHEDNEVYDKGTQFARLGLFPGLKLPDMGDYDQCYNGEIIMLNRDNDGNIVSYFFYYDIKSDKEILLKVGTCEGRNL